MAVSCPSPAAPTALGFPECVTLATRAHVMERGNGSEDQVDAEIWSTAATPLRAQSVTEVATKQGGLGGIRASARRSPTPSARAAGRSTTTTLITSAQNQRRRL